MSLNEAPRSVRLHIGFFGCRNAGKSSLVNALTGQQMSVVSTVAGTTTDPVSKSMEILPAGPVVITDTPGFDDTGSLGELRVQRTREILKRTDLAVLVVDAEKGLRQADLELLGLFQEQDTACMIAWNKADLVSDARRDFLVRQESLPGAGTGRTQSVCVSALTDENIVLLREMIGQAAKLAEKKTEHPLVEGLISPMDLVILVIPIDESAPKGRLILPQQQVLRDILDHGAQALCVRENELDRVISNPFRKPSLVITDSQAFGHVAKAVPEEIPMTSFSILMARRKGVLPMQLQGVSAIRAIEDGDRILIAEGCTHHRQCGDIGTVKLPAWIREYTGKEPVFETSSGLSFPENPGRYKVIIHCGSCMLNEKEVQARNRQAALQNVPITNYGMAIALVHGILDRALAPIPEAKHRREELLYGRCTV
ncbi:MAG TPA: [FeFe] hydrogenase H-cluster maturation GTPase HydF [Lachnospiraceae bacterium]|nr:[FeFe] hydrogenase H-cluster maturation GTPase HydF [Lachnospiraceae bacterium]